MSTLKNQNKNSYNNTDSPLPLSTMETMEKITMKPHKKEHIFATLKTHESDMLPIRTRLLRKV